MGGGLDAMTFDETMADPLVDLMIESMGLDAKNSRVLNLLRHLYKMGYIDGEFDARRREIDRLYAKVPNADV